MLACCNNACILAGKIEGMKGKGVGRKGKMALSTDQEKYMLCAAYNRDRKPGPVSRSSRGQAVVLSLSLSLSCDKEAWSGACSTSRSLFAI